MEEDKFWFYFTILHRLANATVPMHIHEKMLLNQALLDQSLKWKEKKHIYSKAALIIIKYIH